MDTGKDENFIILYAIDYDVWESPQYGPPNLSEYSRISVRIALDCSDSGI